MGKEYSGEMCFECGEKAILRAFEEVVGMEIEIGNMDLFEEGWFMALGCLAVQRISEATGEPAKLVAEEICNEDEALHIVTASGRVFHVSYYDVTDVSAVEEIRCPRCGEWVTTDMVEEHQELQCVEEEDSEEEVM